MRILFVLHTYPPDAWGGTELHVQGIARTLAPDHDVAIFCRGGDPLSTQGQVSRSSEGIGDRVIEVTRFNNLFQGYESFEWTYKHEEAHRAFERELERFRPDMVHVHHLTGLSTTILEAVKARNLPLVFSLHDFWMVCPRGQRLHPKEGICETIDRKLCHECLGRIWPDWFPEAVREGKKKPGRGNDIARFDEHMHAALALPDLLLTPSSFHRDRMLEGTGIDPDRIIALAHGLDHRPFAALPDHDPSPRPRVIGYIGTVINTKGVHVLLEAFNRLDDADLELRIHGDTPAFHENAEYLSLMRDRVRSRGPVKFMGHYDNDQVAALLSEVDILVVPSLWWETFSLTIRESILAGVPVVVSDIGAMKEAIDDSSAGLLFKTGDPEDLARTLRRLIDDDKLRRACSGHRELVKTVHQNAQDYLRIYRDATRIAENRRGTLNVTSSSFPRKPKGDRDRGRGKRTSEAGRKPSKRREAPDVENDVSFSIEKIGDGDVRVQSAVERGESTKVSFVFDYEPTADESEVRLTIDFKKKDIDVIPTRGDLPEAKAPQRGEAVGADSMAKAQDPDWDAEMRERAMYMKAGDLGRRDAERLDKLVDDTTLDEDDRRPAKAPRRSRDEEAGSGRSRSRDEGRGRDEGRRESRGRGRDQDRDDRPRRSRDQDRDRNRDRDQRDRSDEPRRERQERGSRSLQREGASEERSSRGRRSSGPEEKKSSPPRERTDRKSTKPKKPARDAKKAPKDAADVVWDAEEQSWQLPEKSIPAPKKEDLRAPNYRVGKQPGHGGARDGDFGDGV